MNTIKILSALLILTITLTYTVLFTSIGNSFLMPIVEDKINTSLHINTQVKSLSLRMNTFAIKLAITPHNSVEIVGNYALFSQNFNAAYRVKLNKPIELESLVNQRLMSKIYTQGTIKGILDNFIVTGKSDVADSNSSYTLHIVNNTILHVNANVKDIQSAKLLTMLDNVAYVEGGIDANISLDTHDMNHPIGTIAIKLEKGTINSYLMQRDFNISIDNTPFTMQSNLELTATHSKLLSNLTSTLANCNLKAIKSTNKQLLATTEVQIQELGLLEPIVHIPLRGALDFNATLKGTTQHSLLHVNSNIAHSQTTLESKLVNYKPLTLSVETNHLDIQTLLQQLHQKSYAKDGFINANIYINDLENLKGNINLDASNITLNSKLLAQTLHVESVPPIDANLSLHTSLIQNSTSSNIYLNSSLFTLSTQKTVYNLETSSLDSDFKMKNIQLSKFKFITNRELASTLDLVGSVHKNDHLLVKARSYFCDGELDISLKDRDLHVSAKNLNSMKVLNTLQYPPYFYSNVSAYLQYNLRDKSGTLDAKINDGRFKHNSIFNAVKDYTQVDLYTERFKGTLNSMIENDIIISDLDLTSKNSSITSQKGYLNSRSKRTNTTLHVKVNENPIDFHLKGNLNQPDISIDASKLVQKEVGQFINRLFK